MRLPACSECGLEADRRTVVVNSGQQLLGQIWVLGVWAARQQALAHRVCLLLWLLRITAVQWKRDFTCS